jgi:hypothetical protein
MSLSLSVGGSGALATFIDPKRVLQRYRRPGVLGKEKEQLARRSCSPTGT